MVSNVRKLSAGMPLSIQPAPFSVAKPRPNSLSRNGQQKTQSIMIRSTPKT